MLSCRHCISGSGGHTPAGITISTKKGEIVFHTSADKSSPEEPAQRAFMVDFAKLIANAGLPVTAHTRNQPDGPDWTDIIVLEHTYA